MAGVLDDDEFGRWRAQADRAGQTAALAMAGDQHEWACFLSEQAAQLAVKGLLHGCGEPAWGHDLTVLEAEARAAIGDPWPETVQAPSARLSRHYIPTRYPDAHPSGPPGSHYRQEDAESALADADELLATVDAVWRELRRESDDDGGGP